MSAFEEMQSSQGRSNRRKFGLLRVYANYVVLQAGASYRIPDIMTEDGSGKVFNGKALTSESDPKRNVHVVLALRQTRQDGSPYDAVRDVLTFTDEFQKFIKPSLVDVFGPNFGTELRGKSVPVCVEEVETGETFTGRDGNAVARKTWRVMAKYGSEQEMKAAADAYFAQFGGGSTAALPADVTDTARTLWGALAGNEATFMQVVAQDARLSQYDSAKLLQAVRQPA